MSHDFPSVPLEMFQGYLGVNAKGCYAQQIGEKEWLLFVEEFEMDTELVSIFCRADEVDYIDLVYSLRNWDFKFFHMGDEAPPRQSPHPRLHYGFSVGASKFFGLMPEPYKEYWPEEPGPKDLGDIDPEDAGSMDLPW